MQKVGLIFVVIQSLEQLYRCPRTLYPSVMTSCDPICAQTDCVIDKGTELDLSVAGNIRVGRAAATIFVQEIIKYLFAVFAGKLMIGLWMFLLVACVINWVKLLQKHAF